MGEVGRESPVPFTSFWCKCGGTYMYPVSRLFFPLCFLPFLPSSLINQNPKPRQRSRIIIHNHTTYTTQNFVESKCLRPSLSCKRPLRAWRCSEPAVQQFTTKFTHQRRPPLRPSLQPQVLTLSSRYGPIPIKSLRLIKHQICTLVLFLSQP